MNDVYKFSLLRKKNERKVQLLTTNTMIVTSLFSSGLRIAQARSRFLIFPKSPVRGVSVVTAYREIQLGDNSISISNINPNLAQHIIISDKTTTYYPHSVRLTNGD